MIEMLIVVVIIGILAAALIPRLQDVQGRARDVQRKKDISDLGKALMLFYMDTKKFPGGDCTYHLSKAVTEVPGAFMAGPYETHYAPQDIVALGYITQNPQDPQKTRVNPGVRTHYPCTNGYYLFRTNFKSRTDAVNGINMDGYILGAQMETYNNMNYVLPSPPLPHPAGVPGYYINFDTRNGKLDEMQATTCQQGLTKGTGVCQIPALQSGIYLYVGSVKNN